MAEKRNSKRILYVIKVAGKFVAFTVLVILLIQIYHLNSAVNTIQHAKNAELLAQYHDKAKTPETQRSDNPESNDSPLEQSLTLAQDQAKTSQKQRSKSTKSNDKAGEQPHLVGADQAKTFEERWLLAINNADADGLSRLILWEDLINNSIPILPRDQNADTKLKKAYDKVKEKIKHKLSNPTSGADSMIGSMIAGVRFGGKVSEVNIRLGNPNKSDAKPTKVITRYVGPYGGPVNYVQLSLTEDKDKQPVANDLYFFSSLEPLTVIVRRLFWKEMSLQNELSIDDIKPIFQSSVLGSGDDEEYFRSIPNLDEIINNLKSGEESSALNKLNKLPVSIQHSRFGLALRLTACQKIDADNYTNTVKNFREINEEDPGIELVAAVGFLAIHKSTSNQIYLRYAEQAIKKFGDYVGATDPYVLTLNGELEFRMRKFELAKEKCTAAMKADLSMIDPFWTLVSISLAENNTEETFNNLRKIKERFSVNLNPIITKPEYKNFLDLLDQNKKDKLLGIEFQLFKKD